MQQQLLWWAESGKDPVSGETELEAEETTSQRWHETWTLIVGEAGFGKMCSRV